MKFESSHPEKWIAVGSYLNNFVKIERTLFSFHREQLKAAASNCLNLFQLKITCSNLKMEVLNVLMSTIKTQERRLWPARVLF